MWRTITVALSCLLLSTAQARNLSFKQALNLAYQQNLSIQAQRANVQAAHGQLLQAGLLPNPTLSLASENIAGSGSYRQFNAAETTLKLEQPLVLSGRLRYQYEAKFADYLVARLKLEAKKSSLYIQVGEAYIDLLYAKQWLQVAARLFRLHAQVVKSIKQRSQVGASALLDLKLAQVALTKARLIKLKAHRQQQNIKRQLINLLGGVNLDKRPLSDHGLPHTLLSSKQIELKLLQSNLIKVQQGLVQYAKKNVLKVKKQAIPDLNISLGFKHFSEGSDKALVAGLSFTLPMFNTNQGNILTAKAKHQYALRSLQQLKLTLRTALSQYHLNGLQYRDEVSVIKNELLPTVKAVVALTRKGYWVGRYRYAELAHAMQLLLEQEKQYIKAHSQLDKTIININGRLLATSSIGK